MVIAAANALEIDSKRAHGRPETDSSFNFCSFVVWVDFSAGIFTGTFVLNIKNGRKRKQEFNGRFSCISMYRTFNYRVFSFLFELGYSF